MKMMTTINMITPYAITSNVTALNKSTVMITVNVTTPTVIIKVPKTKKPPMCVLPTNGENVIPSTHVHMITLHAVGAGYNMENAPTKVGVATTTLHFVSTADWRSNVTTLNVSSSTSLALNVPKMK